MKEASVRLDITLEGRDEDFVHGSNPLYDK